MSPASFQHQRGAVTLLGALFLILTLLVLLEVAQRMAATDITDTALHNDGIDALFLAETGLERAAWRYSAGTCATLPLEADNAGRGSFQIVSATPVGTLCRVRVEGSVMTTTAANSVRRIIEGDLDKSGYTGWAVGDQSGGAAVLLGWDGSNWTQPGPYAGLAVAALTGVHCVAANDCWAVGNASGGSANINYWDGSTWTRSNVPALPNSPLNDVYCLASDDCWAVGNTSEGNANTNHWDGSAWSNISATSLPNQRLNSVYCVTGNDCWAVGNPTSGNANINHWDGSAWSNIAAPAVPGKILNSVSCVAGNDCWAVGAKNGSNENINHWDGSAWSNISAPGIPDKDMNSVVCVAGNDCWAVGDQSGGENIDHWNGSSWSRFGPYGSIANDNLNAVDIVSATEGYTVGNNGTIAAWDGLNWAGQSSPVTSTLNSVSVSGGAGSSGNVMLVRWSEVIQ